MVFLGFEGFKRPSIKGQVLKQVKEERLDLVSIKELG